MWKAPATIHLVGETIDARQARLRAQTGERVKLIQDIDANQADNSDDIVLSPAVRLAHYLCPSGIPSLDKYSDRRRRPGRYLD